MKHVGDITKLDGAKLEPVWVVTGGSPCQDLSVAGKRAGLKGERSGLFMEQIRVIKEMRENDKRNGRTDKSVRCRWMVWENVPGAFSSAKGADFSAVLEETIGVVSEAKPVLDVPSGGWPKWGAIVDPLGKWSVAWRTMDAQYWGSTIVDGTTGTIAKMGTPQRRRRIALVADFAGDTAPHILFGSKQIVADT